MKPILVIGLGSMGKRRIRNLQALGVSPVIGVDKQKKRCDEAAQLYGVETFVNLDEAMKGRQFHCWIISLPPDIHHVYIKLAMEHRIPCFVEASVLDTDFDEIIGISRKYSLLVAPSCTLNYHPAIKMIIDFVHGGVLGKVTNVIYHSGQYLPDWHTFEKVSEYYVSNPETGGAREIVPFELTWLTHLFGFPKRVCGLFMKTIDIEGAEKIEDTYNSLLDYGSFIVNLTVDVVSRCATRRLTINGSEKQLYWNWDEEVIKLFDPATNQWIEYPYKALPAHEEYNKNISEQLYIEELQAFLQAVEGRGIFPNTMEHDKEVLRTLYRIEESAKSATYK